MRMSLVIGGCVIAVAACGGGTDSFTAVRVPVTAPAPRTVTYRLEGTTNQASITYRMPTGTSQQSDIDVPIRRKSDNGLGIEFTASPGQFLYLSAQNSNATGTIICVIEVNGVEVSRNSASGAYAIASCDA